MLNLTFKFEKLTSKRHILICFQLITKFLINLEFLCYFRHYKKNTIWNNKLTSINNNNHWEKSYWLKMTRYKFILNTLIYVNVILIVFWLKVCGILIV